MSFWLEYIDGGGRRHTIQYDGEGEVWIGRRLGCSIHSFDENLSREHCWVEFDAERGQCVLQDNASTDGTYVNGSPIVTQPLEHGDVIECASLLITFWTRPRGTIDTSELDQLSVRLDESHARAERLQAERDAALNTRRSLEDELLSARDELRNAQRNSDTNLRVRLDTAVGERQELDEQVERFRVREAKLNAQLDWLENRVRELEENPENDDDDPAHSLRAELAEAERRLASSDAESRQLSDELEEMRETLTKVRKKLEQTTHSLERQRAEADEAASKRDEIWAELAQARQTIEDLEEVVANQESMIETLRHAARERESLIQKLRTS